MIFASFASGSSGNCSLIGTDTALILIDCGISAKKIDESLRALGFCTEKLDGIFLTHEHADHIKGLKRLMRAFSIPVYGSKGTLSALSAALKDEYFNFAGKALLHELRAEEPLQLKNMRILPFAISHDAAQPFGYRIEAEEAPSFFEEDGDAAGGISAHRSGIADAAADAGIKKTAAAVATDMGYFDDAIRDHLLGLDVLLLEANHDRGMLANGPYPIGLKRRIMSREGHLCNNSCGQLLSEIASPRLKHVFLGHLSRENNTPGLALETVASELSKNLGPLAKELVPKISVAPYNGMSQLIRI